MTTPALTAFPQDVLRHLFKEFDQQDRGAVMRTCKALYHTVAKAASRAMANMALIKDLEYRIAYQGLPKEAKAASATIKSALKLSHNLRRRVRLLLEFDAHGVLLQVSKIGPKMDLRKAGKWYNNASLKQGVVIMNGKAYVRFTASRERGSDASLSSWQWSVADKAAGAFHESPSPLFNRVINKMAAQLNEGKVWLEESIFAATLCSAKEYKALLVDSSSQGASDEEPPSSPVWVTDILSDEEKPPLLCS